MIRQVRGNGMRIMINAGNHVSAFYIADMGAFHTGCSATSPTK